MNLVIGGRRAERHSLPLAAQPPPPLAAGAASGSIAALAFLVLALRAAVRGALPSDVDDASALARVIPAVHFGQPREH